jgi:hypothetical protein
MSCLTRRNGRSVPPAATEPRNNRKGFGVCFEGVMIEWASGSWRWPSESNSEGSCLLGRLRRRAWLVSRMEETLVERGRKADISDMAGQ